MASDAEDAGPHWSGRIYAIGDIHGRYDLFRRLVDCIERDQATRDPVETRIILLGDIVDRGPQSAELVSGCMELTAFTSQFIVLKGNHEQMMVEALRGDLRSYEQWLKFGGKETLLSWGVEAEAVEAPVTRKGLRLAADAVGKSTIEWLDKLPLYYRYGKYLFVHAGIRPGIPLSKQHADDLLWIEDEFLDSDVEHDMIVIHGHTVSENGAVIKENRIGIDTGAYKTGQLTAIGIDASNYWLLQVCNRPLPIYAQESLEAMPCGANGKNANLDAGAAQ